MVGGAYLSDDELLFLVNSTTDESINHRLPQHRRQAVASLALMLSRGACSKPRIAASYRRAWR